MALVDLSLYPLTPLALASRRGCEPATIRRWAAAGRISGAVQLRCGWRFAEDATEITPAQHDNERRVTARGVGCAPDEDLTAIESMSFKPTPKARAALKRSAKHETKAPDSTLLKDAGAGAQGTEKTASPTADMREGAVSRHGARVKPDLHVSRHVRPLWPAARKARAKNRGRHTRDGEQP